MNGVDVKVRLFAALGAPHSGLGSIAVAILLLGGVLTYPTTLD